MEDKKGNGGRRQGGSGRPKRFERQPPDPVVLDAVRKTEESLSAAMEPTVVRGLNAFQQKQFCRHFGRTDEYKIKAFTESDNAVALKVYPVGNLQRLAKTMAQEVLLTGEPKRLPAMGSFERFVVHETIKKRGGLRTESHGEENDRHVEIHPVYGRTPRKTKRKLTR